MRFRIEHNHLTFEGVFLADVRPYELALACLGHDFVLLFKVSHSYEIDTYLGVAYTLAKTLRNGAGNGNPLSSRQFLQEIDTQLPQAVRAGDQPTRVDV